MAEPILVQFTSFDSKNIVISVEVELMIKEGLVVEIFFVYSNVKKPVTYD